MEFKWIIRFLDTAEAFTAFDYRNDEIILYIGMYGIPSYVIWWVAPDKTKTLGIGTTFELALSAGRDKFGYHNSYIVENVIFDVRRQKYRLYAVSIPHFKLEKGTRIRSAMLTKQRSEPVSGFDFIYALMKQYMPQIEVVPIKPVTDRVKYLQVSLERYQSALDLITKICSENQWEWYLTQEKLFIGDVFKIEKLNVLDKDQDEDHTKDIQVPYLNHHVIGAKGAEPGMMYGKEGRVLWVKYYFSVRKGTLASVMVTPFVKNRISEKSYISTLQEEALALGRVRLNKLLTAQTVILGKHYGEIDEYDDRSPNAANYEMPEFSGDPLNPSKDLRTHGFKTEYTPQEARFRYVQQLKRTTPYAGDGVGMLFPHTTGHSLLISPEGERDMGLIGPGYFGRDDKVPVRYSPKDFRLQFDDSGAIYYAVGGGAGALFISPTQAITLDVGGWPHEQHFYGAPFDPVSPSLNITHDWAKMSDGSGLQEVKVTDTYARLNSATGIINLESGGRIRIYTPKADFNSSASFIELSTAGVTEVGSDSAVEIAVYGEGTKDFPFLKIELQGTDVNIEGNVKILGNLEATNVKASAVVEGNVVKDVKGVLSAKIPP